MMTPCILHTGVPTENGYGRTHGERAHRYAYRKAHGLSKKDIEGVVVRHKCDVRLCVNPEHLETGTQLDNIQDMVDRNRQRPGKPRSLSDEQVREIRVALAGKHSQRSLARRYKTLQSTIRAIKLGKTYQDVL